MVCDPKLGLKQPGLKQQGWIGYELRNFCRALLLGCVACLLAAAQKAADLPTPSTLINKRLPKWVRVGGEYRTRFEGYSGGNFSDGSSDAYWLSRTRLSLTLQPLPWGKVFAEVQDARVIRKHPGLPPFENVWDLRSAYLELGDIDKKPFGLRVGRQELFFGENRIVGGAAWANATRAFDGVRAVVRFAGNRLDFLATSVVVNVNGTWDHHQQGNNFHGVYGDFPKLIPHAVIQPYVFWRLQPRVRNEAGVVANVDEKIPGFRLVGTLPRGFDYNIEMAYQFGSVGSDRIQAWLGHWLVGRTWKKLPFSPRVWGEYNYLSGDANPRDGIRGTFDALYPTVHDKFGFADQFAGRNLKDIRWGVEGKLPKGVNASLELNDWRLASAVDGLYSAQGTVIGRSPTGIVGTHVGNEIDLITTWKLRGSVLVGAGVGYILPGAFLKATTPGKPYLYPYIMFTYKL